jgi:putative nucleotidyltransferase with HDIG domain
LKLKRQLTLGQRAFLAMAVPTLLVICGSFWALDALVRARAAEDLRAGLVRTEDLLRQERIAGETKLRQSMSILTESAGLKAAVSLHRELAQSGAMSEESVRAQIQSTLEAQLRDLRQLLHFDVYVIADAEGRALATLPAGIPFEQGGQILSHGGKHFNMVSVPMNRGIENLGFVAVGSELPLAGKPVVLLHRGQVLASGMPGIVLPARKAEQFVSGGLTYAASYETRGEHTLVTLRELDSAIAPALASMRTVFASAVSVALLVSIGVSYWAARSTARPIERLTQALEASGKLGELPERLPNDAAIPEIDLLVQRFDEASRAVRASRGKLEEAYTNFMGAMAEALDARDPYTAGHSRRVADYSVRIARALQLPAAEIEHIRLGGMLHDIGKIGVPDTILHKHEKLSDEEFAVIQQHPLIGRRILERVGRFEEYLPAIELHHENHDGTGYPHGLKGTEIPIDARIIHVADAYDAMTSDRPYRKRMPEDKVRRILRECAGTQFDPEIVDTFLAIRIEVLTAISNDLEKLSNAITYFQSGVQSGEVGPGGEPSNDGAGEPIGTAFAGPGFNERTV